MENIRGIFCISSLFSLSSIHLFNLLSAYYVQEIPQVGGDVAVNKIDDVTVPGSFPCKLDLLNSQVKGLWEESEA